MVLSPCSTWNPVIVNRIYTSSSFVVRRCRFEADLRSGSTSSFFPTSTNEKHGPCKTLRQSRILCSQDGNFIGTESVGSSTELDIGQSVSQKTSIPMAPNIPNQQLPKENQESASDAKDIAKKKSPLTAREKFRVARTLSRYASSVDTSKPEMGKTVMDVLRESDKGKPKSGLPLAPTNLFDDSKRGMPKQGLTFEFPGGNEVLFIVSSFVLISTLMFGTTYIVWKVGAIHYNEY